MKGTTHTKTVYVRKNVTDDVYLKTSVEVFTPEEKNSKSRRSYLQNTAVIALASTLMVTSAGVTYGELHSTGSFFSDTETSSVNQFMASLLDFSAADSPQSKKVIPLGSPVTFPVTITPAAGSVSTTFRVTIEKTAGSNDTLCNALVADVTSPPFAYNGPLLSLNGTAPNIASLTLTVTLPSNPGLPEGTPCNFDIVFRGWNSYVPESTGYTDEERIAVTVLDPPAPEGEVLGDTASSTQEISQEPDPVPFEEPTPTPDETTPPPGGGGGSVPEPPSQPETESQNSEPQDPPAETAPEPEIPAGVVTKDPEPPAPTEPAPEQTTTVTESPPTETPPAETPPEPPPTEAPPAEAPPSEAPPAE